MLTGPAALVILTWEDYGAALSLVALDGGKEDDPSARRPRALPVGLHRAAPAGGDVDRLRWAVRWKSDPPGRDVAFVLCTLIWDGKAFHVKVRKGTLAAKDKEAAL